MKCSFSSLRTATLPVFLALLFQTSDMIHAQGGYVSVGGGYGLSAGSQLLGVSTTMSQREGVYGSFGQGIKLTVAGGHMFNGNVGAEVALSYLIGRAYEITSSTTGGTSSVNKQSGSGLFVVPALVLSTNAGSARLFIKSGVAIGFVKIREEVSSTIRQAQTQNRVALESDATGGASIGLSGAVGVLINSKNRISFFAELSVVTMTFSPSQVQITKAELDGQNVLSQITDRTISYKDSYNASERNVQTGIRVPFSSIGINGGVRLNL